MHRPLLPTRHTTAKTRNSRPSAVLHCRCRHSTAKTEGESEDYGGPSAGESAPSTPSRSFRRRRSVDPSSSSNRLSTPQLRALARCCAFRAESPNSSPTAECCWQRSEHHAAPGPTTMSFRPCGEVKVLAAYKMVPFSPSAAVFRSRAGYVSSTTSFAFKHAHHRSSRSAPCPWSLRSVAH